MGENSETGRQFSVSCRRRHSWKVVEGTAGSANPIPKFLNPSIQQYCFLRMGREDFRMLKNCDRVLNTVLSDSRNAQVRRITMGEWGATAGLCHKE